MKKLRGLLIGVVFFSILIWPVASVLASQLDASNETGAISLLTIGSHSKCAQTFKPGLPTLNSISVYLGNGDGSVTLRLIRVATGETVYGEAKGIGAWTWYTFTPGAGSVSVFAGEVYEINISAGAVSTTQWKLGTNGYPNGAAEYPDLVADQDFYFRTYGTPGASPSTSPSVTPTTSAAPGSGVVGSAPSANIDTSIKPATDLKAKDESDRSKSEPKVKLTWTASTTKEIDGNRVYAKKEGEADFALVAEINKDAKEYTDAKVEFDQKYTYMLRAYKGTAESANSNEASVTPQKTEKKLKTFALTGEGPLWKQWPFWTLVALGLALVGFVIWHLIDRRKKKKIINIETLNPKL